MQVLYADRHLLVVNKPAGVLSQPVRRDGWSVLAAARKWLRHTQGARGRPFVGLVHRLDRDTTGVMVLARTSKAARRLSAQWRSGSVTKVYAALVAPVPERPAGTLVHWLLRQGQPPRTAVHDAPCPGARRAELAFRILDVRGDVALLWVAPRTGRAHQIRAQLAAAGAPLLGDARYGGRGRPPAFLHASVLAFDHPVGGRRLRFALPLPERWPPWAAAAWALNVASPPRDDAR